MYGVRLLRAAAPAVACAALAALPAGSASAPEPVAPPILFLDQGVLTLVDPTSARVRRVQTRRGGSTLSAHWSPDGRRLAYVAYENVGEGDQVVADVTVADATARRFRRVARLPTDAYLFGWTPDGSRLIVGVGLAVRRYGVVDVMTGAWRELRSTNAARAVAGRWSPDGRWFLYFDPQRLETIVYTAGGSRRSVLPRTLYDPTWLPNGSGLAAIDGNDVRRVRIDGGLGPVLQKAEGVRSFSLSPDGRRIAFTDTRPSGNADVSPLFVASVGGPPRELVDSLDGTDVEWRPRCTRYGTGRDDVIFGTPRRDVVCALGGDDVVFGRGGADVIVGGDGDDCIEGGAGDDWLLGGAGDDRLRATAGGADVVDGDPGGDRAATAGAPADVVRDIERTDEVRCRWR